MVFIYGSVLKKQNDCGIRAKVGYYSQTHSDSDGNMRLESHSNR